MHTNWNFFYENGQNFLIMKFNFIVNKKKKIINNFLKVVVRSILLIKN